MSRGVLRFLPTTQKQIPVASDSGRNTDRGIIKTAEYVS